MPKSVVIKYRVGNHVKPSYIAKTVQYEKPPVERDFEALKKSLLEEENEVPKDIKRKLRVPPTDMNHTETINTLFPTIEQLREMMKVVPILKKTRKNLKS